VMSFTGSFINQSAGGRRVWSVAVFFDLYLHSPLMSLSFLICSAPRALMLLMCYMLFGYIIINIIRLLAVYCQYM